MVEHSGGYLVGLVRVLSSEFCEIVHVLVNHLFESCEGDLLEELFIAVGLFMGL